MLSMARPRKWENDAQRRAAQNDRRKVDRSVHDVQFVGVDGEGVGRGKDHKYVLLSVGQAHVSDPYGLSFTTIMSFLYSQYMAQPSAAFVGFFLGYDFTHWLKGLPENRARMLLTDEGIARRQRKKNAQQGPFPVRFDGWEFDILGMKRFKLRPDTQGASKTRWMYICDSGSFFQTSLMSAIHPEKWEVPVVSEVEYEKLAEGKARRDHAELDDTMREYNALENVVLGRLMGRLNEGLVKMGVRLKKDQWFGPGQVAQAWLTGIGCPQGNVVRETFSRYRFVGVHTGTDLADAIRGSYYGGWFEIFAHGIVPGTAWEYDINSAYPYIAARLPCLLHGEWTYGGPGIRTPYPGGTALVYASVLGSDPHVGSMLHRREDGSILRPHVTEGWYWYDELNAAYVAGFVKEIKAKEWWFYHACDCPSPLRGLVGLYDHRLRVGKNSTEGKAAKAGYNSVYGKFAQSVGNPRFGNALYASRITSGCRTMITEAIGSHPGGSKNVLMVATDGVYFRDEHPQLALGQAMGEWEAARKDNLTLFKPGVYWDDTARARIVAGEQAAFKARGINATAFAEHLAGIDRAFAAWPERYPHERDPDGPREGWYPKIEYRNGFSMVTCVQALARGTWANAGVIGHAGREELSGCDGCDGQHFVQDADPVQKRHSGYYDGKIYRSRPYPDGGGTIVSQPYKRRFGQPDDEFGINDDGELISQWARMLYD
jgi:hypothetical protein